MKGSFKGLALLGAVAAWTAPVGALEFNFGDNSVRIENLVTVGALMRMQDRDPSLIGKPNLTPGLCLQRTSGTSGSGPSTSLNDNAYTVGFIPAACATSNEAAIAQFVAAPGSYSSNGDNGNMSFDKYDLVHATAKVTTDLTLDLFGFNVFARGLYFFDNTYNDLEENHFDTTLSPTTIPFSGAGKDTIGSGFEMLDYFVSRTFEFGDHPVAFKLGNQVLNWGESAFLIPNSLNSISPPNQALLRLPGFDIKELFQPVGMAFISAGLFEGVSLEGFYQYEWKPVIADPPGSFFSTSDTIGPGGSYAMLSFARAAEDPGFPTDDPRYPGRRGFYRAIDTCDPTHISPPGQLTPCIDSAGVLGSTSSRTIFRDYEEEARRAPNDGGQYGVALKYFAEWLNGGTDFGFYYANYHSRFPVVSAIAAQETCIGADATSLFLPAALGGCGVANVGGVPLFGTPAEREPLPVDTARLIVEYPEDIRLYGVSFNTTLGDFAIAGEYTFRDNLPMQVHTTDLLFAALQPAFPRNNVPIPPSPAPALLTIPGRRDAAPDFLMTNYRGEVVTPGMYIRGYERMKQGQADVTILKTFGGDNWVRATQITALLELGHTYVFDFPDLSELQFQGAGTDTHISNGADGTVGINPRDVRTNPDDPSTSYTGVNNRQNPTTHADRSGFGTAQSYGYRLVFLTRYDDAFMGVNFELLTAFFHDVDGVGPGIGQNFVEDRMTMIGGVRFDYLSRYSGEVRYSWFTGGENRDQLRDRDNLLVWLGYQF